MPDTTYKRPSDAELKSKLSQGGLTPRIWPSNKGSLAGRSNRAFIARASLLRAAYGQRDPAKNATVGAGSSVEHTTCAPARPIGRHVWPARADVAPPSGIVSTA